MRKCLVTCERTFHNLLTNPYCLFAVNLRWHLIFLLTLKFINQFKIKLFFFAGGLNKALFFLFVLVVNSRSPIDNLQLLLEQVSNSKLVIHRSKPTIYLTFIVISNSVGSLISFFPIQFVTTFALININWFKLLNHSLKKDLRNLRKS